MSDQESISSNTIQDDTTESSTDTAHLFEWDENHFSQNADVLSMTSVGEIETAIEKCKENILSQEEAISEEKRLLVQRLVKLRLKLQEVQELEIYMDPKKLRLVQSHKFASQNVLQFKFRTPQIYCETCSGLIWIPVQNCFVCTECEYVSHGQCLNNVRRVCASVKVLENPNFIRDICPESSLENQNYRCAECKTRISFDTTLDFPQLCDYSGLYFCKFCHWNHTSVIPARIILNWDFQQYPVSQASKQYLKLVMKKSIINIEEENSRLFSFVEDLQAVKRIREDIMIMKEYILACKDALDGRLLRLLEDRQHFVDSSNFYSLQDLVDLMNKELLAYLEPIHLKLKRHITQECAGCQGKGHVCRLCNQLPALYPFETSTVALCNGCKSVFHRHCIVKRDTVCPKCSTKGPNNK